MVSVVFFSSDHISQSFFLGFHKNKNEPGNIWDFKKQKTLAIKQRFYLFFNENFYDI